MKKITFTLFVAFLFLQSCSEIPLCENCTFNCFDRTETDIITNECVENWDCTFAVNPQSRIDPTTLDGIAKGDKNVFQLINTTEGEPEIADDEYTTILVFELDESRNSFAVQDNQLKDMNVRFRNLCYCTQVEFKTIDSGCIQGEKQEDGSWLIQGKILASDTDETLDFNFEAHFIH